MINLNWFFYVVLNLYGCAKGGGNFFRLPPSERFFVPSIQWPPKFTPLTYDPTVLTNFVTDLIVPLIPTSVRWNPPTCMYVEWKYFHIASPAVLKALPKSTLQLSAIRACINTHIVHNHFLYLYRWWRFFAANYTYSPTQGGHQGD